MSIYWKRRILVGLALSGLVWFGSTVIKLNHMAYVQTQEHELEVRLSDNP